MVQLLRQGLESLKANRRLWLYLFLTKLGLALVISVPALMAAQSALDNTLYSTPLLKEWSIKVLGELIAQRPFVFGGAFVVTLAFGLLALILRQFLNGGIYRAFSQSNRISRREFFAESGERFGTHIKITGTMAIFYLLSGGIGMWLGSMAGGIVENVAPNATPLNMIVPLGVTGLTLVPAVAFSDSMRAVSVQSGSASTRGLLVDAFAFYRRRWVQLVVAYIVLFLAFAVIWVAIEKLTLGVTGNIASKIGIVIEMLLFQACSFVRTGQSLWFTASVVRGYQDSRTKASEPKTVEVSVD